MREVIDQPLFGITLTLGAYAAAQGLHRRYPWVHPFVATTVFLLLMLVTAGYGCPIPGGLQEYLQGYKVGGDYLTFLLGPATVALAVPLYKNVVHIRRHVMPILAAIGVGAVVAIASGAGMVYALGNNPEIMRVMLPKSVTTPIAVEIVAQLHGSRELGATLVVLTGLFGALVGARFLHLIGIRHELPLGLAMGTAAHGIGTATSLGHSELRGMAAGLAMALNGIVTSLLMIPLYPPP